MAAYICLTCEQLEQYVNGEPMNCCGTQTRLVKVNAMPKIIVALRTHLESFVESHGYASYTSDEEKEQDREVIEAREAIAAATGFCYD